MTEDSCDMMPASGSVGGGGRHLSIITLIDAEIQTLRERGSRPGWTIWALLGALATCSWLMLGELDKPTLPDNTIILTFFILLSFAAMLYEQLSLFAHFFLHSHSPSQSRVVSTREIVPLHPMMLTVGANALVLAAILFKPPPALSGYESVALTLSGFDLMMNAGVVALGFANVPFPVSGPRFSRTRRRGAFAIFLLARIALVLATSAVFLCLMSFVLNCSLPVILREIRIAALGVAIYLILRTLSRLPHESPMLSNLIALRRSMHLGRIPDEKAARQLELILHGLSLTEFYASDISSILSILQKIENELQLGRDELDAIAPLSQDSQMTAINALHTSVEGRLVRVAALVHEMFQPQYIKITKALQKYGELAGAAVDLKDVEMQAAQGMDSFRELARRLFLSIAASLGPEAASAMIMRVTKLCPDLNVDPVTGR